MINIFEIYHVLLVKTKTIKMKYWINEIPGNDKLVIWDGNKIYKANPKENKMRDFESSLKKSEIPEGIFSIYKSQIKMIEMDESKKYICVYFGTDSYEHIRVLNSETKKEIFEELGKSEDVIKTLKELTQSEKTQTQKKAFIVLTFLFIIGFLFSIPIELGSLPDGKYPAILLLLGGLGMKNIILVYLLIILIIGVKFYLVSKTSRIIHAITFK
jgi:hypothetical protein